MAEKVLQSNFKVLSYEWQLLQLKVPISFSSMDALFTTDAIKKAQFFFSLKKTKWACNGKQLRERDSDCQTYLVKNANISPKRGYILPDFKKVRGCMVTSIISHTSFWPYSVEKNGSKIERPESENESSDGNSRNVLLKYIIYITCWNWNAVLQSCNKHSDKVNTSWFLFSFVPQNVANKWVIVHFLKMQYEQEFKVVTLL